MQTTYQYRKFYKVLGFITLGLGVVITILKFFLVGSLPVSFILIFLGYLQIKRYAKPYLIVDKNSIIIHSTAIKSLHPEISLEEIKEVEEKKHKLLLHLKQDKPIPIFLNFLTKEDRSKLKEELPIWVNGGSSNKDFSTHLLE